MLIVVNQVCMRRFMASDPVPDGNGWAPVTLLQAYPENDPEGPCDNKRGDLIYGHFPLDAFGAATRSRKGSMDSQGTRQATVLQTFTQSH